MKIETQDDILRVTGLSELDERQAESLRAKVIAALATRPKIIEVDLAGTTVVDFSGLGALVAIFDRAQQRDRYAILRVLDPQPSVQQLLELTRLHRIFHIVHRTAPVRVS